MKKPTIQRALSIFLGGFSLMLGNMAAMAQYQAPQQNVNPPQTQSPNQPNPNNNQPPSNPQAPSNPSQNQQNQNVVLGMSGNSQLGNFLVDPNGRTLYTSANDKSGTSNCSDQCTQIWIPYTVKSGDNLVAGNDIKGSVGTITRDDGSLQVTYIGMPLYYFSGDSKAGDTSGQGMNNIWMVAKP